MRRTGRRLACGLLPLVLASCVPPPPPAPPPPLAPAVAAKPVTVAGVGTFRLRGSARQGGLLFGQAPGGTTVLTLDGKPVRIAPDGGFVIGFARDAPAAATLRAETADGMVYSEPIAVAPRAWDIQSLPTLAKGTTPTPEFLARRRPELARIAAARAVHAESEGWRQRFVWPVTGRISGAFGSQRIYAGEPGAPHSGVDIARPSGTAVVAPADGVVVLAAAAPFTLEGNLLMIDHGMGLVSAFLHLSRIDVAEGARVRQGQPIGAIGATGRATGPHLHWGLNWTDVRIDPAPLAGPMRG